MKPWRTVHRRSSTSQRWPPVRHVLPSSWHGGRPRSLQLLRRVATQSRPSLRAGCLLPRGCEVSELLDKGSALYQVAEASRHCRVAFVACPGC
mmetsp:Transcript_21818/g.70628  ORF Transcript_21818/g.70628 Transcript_21818/m.70628 type:complete len:93 (+) Transcript_21818:788-1066(+)